jgi:tRNA-splicing ligase RtcB
MILIDNIPVWGTPQPNAVEQMKNAMKTAYKGALMADHHLGYAVPVGGVIAYHDKVSPSGVGYDIACGNKAVLTDVSANWVRRNIKSVMDDVQRSISFGVGRVNQEHVDHGLFDSETWQLLPFDLKTKARAQLGTVGSGNHYVDIFIDEEDRVWIGCHFGSRGLGHTIASKYIKLGGGKDGVNVDPVLLDVDSDLGREYIACMTLAGEYAYAGRNWVCERVASILGAEIEYAVHNNHNYAWHENHDSENLWVVRKGATPAFPNQRGFVGGTMGENSVILEGKWSDEGFDSLWSTVHGAGRVMSRTEAAGKFKWKHGQRIQKSQGKITQQMMDGWTQGIELRGGGLDEAPDAYKRLHDVLDAHAGSINILHTLTPIGVAMAGANEHDPYKD